MKISEEPTNYVIVKSLRNCEWGDCDFTVIPVNRSWAESMQKLFEPYERKFENKFIRPIIYYKDSAGNYRFEEEFDILDKKWDVWAYVELDENEEEWFSTPVNSLDCMTLVICDKNGEPHTESSKHTNEEFRTDVIPMSEIVRLLVNI